MIFTIPILILEKPPSAHEPGRSPVFNVRPLFHHEPAQSSEKLSRALNKLQANLRDLLFDLSKDRRHDALATWAFNPPIQTKTIEVRLELKSGSPLKKFFVAHYEAFHRQIAFVPTIPNFAFEIRDSHGFESRVTDVLTEFVRQKEREEDFFVLDSITLHGKARLRIRRRITRRAPVDTKH